MNVWERVPDSDGLPAAKTRDRIIVVTDTGRTEGSYCGSNAVGVALVASKGGLRFVPWASVRAVLMPGTEERIRREAREKA